MEQTNNRFPFTLKVKLSKIISMFILTGMVISCSLSKEDRYIHSKGEQVDGLFYIFNDANKTATLTYEKIIKTDFFDSSHNEELDTMSRNYNVISGTLRIPSSVTFQGVDYAVTAIGDSALMETGKIKKIVIPNSVKKLGNHALYNSTIEDMGDISSIQFIGSAALKSKSLKNVTLPPMESLPANLFYGNRYLETVIFSEGTKKIGEFAFADCSSLKSVELPSSLEEIGMYAFHGCRKLTEIRLPNKLTTISQNSFSDCGLHSISIPSSVDSIGPYAFQYCKELSKVYMSPNIKTLPHDLFAGCDNMHDLIFYNHDNLPKLPGMHYRNGNNTVWYGLFGDWSRDNKDNAYKFNSLQLHVPHSCLIALGWEQKEGIPSGIHYANRSIPKGYNYRDFGMPGYVASSSVVDGITYQLDEDNLTAKIVMPQTNKGWDLETIHHINSVGASRTIELPEEISVDSTTYIVNEIGKYAFVNYPVFGYSVILPPTIKKIDEFAFAYSKLRKIELNEGLEEIGVCAFTDTWLTEIIIPQSVKTILNHSFENNPDLKTIYIKEPIPYLAPSYAAGSIQPCKNYTIYSETNDEIAENDLIQNNTN